MTQTVLRAISYLQIFSKLSLQAYTMSEILEKKDRKSQISEACQMSEKFLEIYFYKMDRNRNTIGKMFLENSTLTWNGNNIKGERKIHFCN